MNLEPVTNSDDYCKADHARLEVPCITGANPLISLSLKYELHSSIYTLMLQGYI